MQSTLRKTRKKTNKLVKKPFTGYYVRVRSRHPSHNDIRGAIKLPFTSVVRFGSTTASDASIECNSIEAVKSSASKVRMKECFDKASVISPKWTKDKEVAKTFKFPLVAKLEFASRGEGMKKLDNVEQLNSTSGNYIYEEFFNGSREYRLHVDSEGCFYTCRKMLKEEAIDRWYRNDSNSVWIMETNPSFDRPTNWDAIVAESVKALKAVGLDVGAVDVKVQSAINEDGEKRKSPKFSIIEINSAPSFGEVTLQKYKEQIPKILKRKWANL